MRRLRTIAAASMLLVASCGGAQGQEGKHPDLPPPEVLAHDTPAQGLVFARGTELQRDHDGAVRRGTLAEPVTVAGVRLPEGTVVWLDRGTVVQARSPDPVPIGDLLAAAGSPIRLPRTGVWDTYEICLASPITVDDHAYAAGEFVEVRWSGDATEARIVGRSELDILMEEGNLGAGCR